ncbi:hypothetical protein SAMN04515674_10855 [Pseudarcicella hirudinis]|uniref:Glycoamylase-like domain-containing protein n=1 Tax=Pseudarcicella hirudinis TaxID=1079859 RepID=A0A1I5UTR8_9BACT|nr:glucoamylase family protein [Pseudarcicella hirudinis]SFP98653.1 hypothetical protein SAMN04515674_10855 [Pseudarcicella hirudinis]
MKSPFLLISFLISSFLFSCKKDPVDNPQPPVIPSSFSFNTLKVDGVFNGFDYSNVSPQPVLKLSFKAPVNQTTISSAIFFRGENGAVIPYIQTFENGDSTIVIQPSTSLSPLTRFIVSVTSALLSKEGGKLLSPIAVNLTTDFDKSDKFPQISDSLLLDKVQRQTFKYFWDFGHQVSGMARERNSSGDIVTTGGTGFGLMAIVVGIERKFISKSEGLSRTGKIVSFLQNNCQKYHGAFPHWLNGSTGATIPFSTRDNAADLVETSYLMQGLLTVRQYFNSATDTQEIKLREQINTLWKNVEWSWFRKNNEDKLYWHWSPDYNWDMNMPVSGWNEALITYVLAASSPAFSIPKSVYENGWARNGSFSNGSSYYGIKLPLGPANGGPLFFSQYSFLGINPIGLSDKYADYWTQNVAHSLINYNYCKANPKSYNGYSENCWGLTASDDNNGYAAHEPNNDSGVISPTAALSSFPYTPKESMQALRFFYYKLGDKLWGDYGFYDAFNLTNIWFANSTLAIDQGPQIIMIENYRSQLLWKLFMSCPEIKTGMKNIGFQSPYL